MKVKELIEKLKNFDQELDVVITYRCGDQYYGCDQKDIDTFDFVSRNTNLEIEFDEY